MSFFRDLNNIFILSTLIFFFSCSFEEKEKNSERLEQLTNFLERQGLHAADYEYVLVEGQVKCKGCAQIWPKLVSKSSMSKAQVLFVVADSLVMEGFQLDKCHILKTEMNLIEDSFPYSANYFLFYKTNGEFTEFVELGAQVFKIPEST